MWTLEGNAQNPEKVHYLLCGKILMVSRREGHILLPDDKSISRHHASFFITHTQNNLKDPRQWPSVKLTDLGAKYGTYVNDGIEKDERIGKDKHLSDEDMICFGKLGNVWRLKYHPLVITTSALQAASKVEIQAAFLKLGGHILPEWCRSCTFLVMDSITLTIKVVCALAAAKHIVTPEYFKKWIEAIEKESSRPEASQFLPPLKEVTLTQADFSPKEQRKQILIGRKFLFASPKQYKQMENAVILAGGNAMLLSAENFKLVSSPGYVLVQTTVEKIQDPARCKLFLAAKDILIKEGLRAIPDANIGLAILYISETHCNPSFVASSLLRPHSSSSIEVEDLKIYATETQSQCESSLNLTSSTRQIPPTSDDPATLSNSSNNKNKLAMSLPTETPINSKMNPKNKENCSVRKRLRTTNEESTSKRTKKDGLSDMAKEMDQTQSMEEMVGNGSEEESQLSETKFKPNDHSTQNYVNMEMISTPNNDSTNVKDKHCSLEPGRSIPFEPYTLPSLKTEILDESFEDDVETQPYVVKEEPEVQSGKRRQSMEDKSWLECKKKKTDEANASNRNHLNELQAATSQTVNKENEDFFAMPCSRERNRHRAEIKKSNPNGETNSKEEHNLFFMPTSSRAERMKKLIKTEQASFTTSHNKETENHSIPSLPRNEKDITTNEKCIPKNENWLSGRTGDTGAIHVNLPIKMEPREEDMSDSIFGGRSLMVIEFKAIVRREKTINSSCNDPNESVGGLKNFKKFRKNRGEITSLPKIIGGKDLVVYRKPKYQLGHWFTDNPDVTSFLEEQHGQDRADDEINAHFDIPVNSNKQTRRRR